MGKLKYLEKNWTQWHFVPQKSRLNSRGIEPGLFGKKLETKCLRHVLALYYYGVCCAESRRCVCHTFSNVVQNCYTCCIFQVIQFDTNLRAITKSVVMYL